MAIRHHRSIWFGLLSAASALGSFGCREPAPPMPHGELELRIDPQASYAMVGRFRVNAVDPYNPSRDIDFDTRTSTARIELPPGSFTLALGAGARLVCAGEDAEPSPSSAVPRLVSASPQIFSIRPGQLTRARIGFGGRRAESGVAVNVPSNQGSEAPDPCGTSLEIASAMR